MHEILNTFHIELDGVEKKEVAHGPKAGPLPFHVTMARTKEEAKEDDKGDKNQLIVYTNRSEIDGGVGAATVGYRDGVWKETTRFYLEVAEEHMVHEVELAGIVLGIDMI